MLARGLVLDEAARTVVATPFPKFFNVGEKHGVVPDLPFEAYEKLDGSLIIAFHHAERWRTATKGAFDSPQAAWAQRRLDAADSVALAPGTTYLFKAVYPENRIVVRYADPALVLLAAYDADGHELTDDALAAVAGSLGGRTARRVSFRNLAELVAHTVALPVDEEGFVLRFADGLRLKLKGAEYRRIHALISRCTPIAMWEAMSAGDDMTAIRRDLPEEFWTDFDDIVRLLEERLVAARARVAEVAVTLAELSDKEVGLRLSSLPEDVRRFVFTYRKGVQGEARLREGLLRTIPPTGNALPGYTPSYAMGRMLEEATS